MPGWMLSIRDTSGYCSPASDRASRLRMRLFHRGLKLGAGTHCPSIAFPRPSGESDHGAANSSWVWSAARSPPSWVLIWVAVFPKPNFLGRLSPHNEKHREALLPSTLQGGNRPGNTQPKAPARKSLFLVLPSVTCAVLSGIPGEKPGPVPCRVTGYASLL